MSTRRCAAVALALSLLVAVVILMVTASDGPVAKPMTPVTAGPAVPFDG